MSAAWKVLLMHVCVCVCVCLADAVGLMIDSSCASAALLVSSAASHSFFGMTSTDRMIVVYRNASVTRSIQA